MPNPYSSLQKTGPIPALAVLVLLVSLPGTLSAQPDRLKGAINSSQWTPLSGHVHPNARAEYDRGLASSSLTLSTVTMVLQPSATQQAALDQLLRQQQDPTSSNYHTWLTPEAFADRFGASQSDIDKIAAWLKSQQLTVTSVARARNAVVFSGTAEQVGAAFHTEIHTYVVDGESHYANSTAPSVPAALQDIVQAVHGLHNFRMKPRIRKLGSLGVAADGMTPLYTSSTSGNHYLAPDDLATIYDLAPLYNAGVTGAGQKIVIVGQSQIVASHLSTFRAYFGLSAANLTTTLAPNTQDPGVVEADEEESDLDIQWSSGIARNATILFVYSYDVTDAVQYAIDQNLAPVLSMSYGECEESDTRSDGLTMRSWAQQGNAQGITWVAASGDTGAAGCYVASSSGGPFGTSSSSGVALAADLPASIPEVTGVGGLEFAEGAGSYWSSTNSSTKSSALSYIPETAWNDSVTDGSPSAGGGGASQFFSKPTWQTGTGVPNDGVRDVPDVALAASADHDGYMVYTTSGRTTTWYVFGGTSCATPTFAGILSLLNQYLVSSGFQSGSGLGNVNANLYNFAASTPAAFHDITTGSNIVSGTNCTGTRCTSTSTISVGYNAAQGYDEATGLGSVDAYNFVTAWHTGALLSKSTPAMTLVASPATLTTAGSTTLTATVTASTSVTPTGSVTFSVGSTTLGVASLSGTTGMATATLTVSGSATGLASNANTITAAYAGDGANNAATSSAALTIVGGSSATPAIVTSANGASFRLSYAPGMILSIFGSNLALSTNTASTAPLPTTLDNISVTIGGFSAPLYYVSPAQLNVQIPYEVATSGKAALVVSNNGQTASSTITMAAAAPGIFADSTSALVPVSTAARGTNVVLYLTGAGAVQPAVATGSTPSSGTTPVPTGTVLVTVGGAAATTSYVGIPSWSVGVLQIDFTVPANAPLGAQSVIVSAGGLASSAVTLTVTN